MSYLIKFLTYFFVILWTILCIPLSVIIFYIMESYELAKVFSGFIEKILRE